MRKRLTSLQEAVALHIRDGEERKSKAFKPPDRLVKRNPQCNQDFESLVDQPLKLWRLRAKLL